MHGVSDPKPRRSMVLANVLIVLVSFLLAIGAAELLLRTSLIPVRNVGASFTVFDHYYGKKLKADFQTTRITPEYSMRLTTNSLGFRGPEPIRFPMHGILFLGDSFTLGYGVSDGQEYPALVGAELEQRFPDAFIPIVNGGVGDTGNGRWIKFLSSDADQYRPRLIVLQVMGNDFADNHREMLFTFTAEGGELREVPQRVGVMRRAQEFVELVPGLADSYLLGKIREIRIPELSFGLNEDVGESIPPDNDAESLTYRLLDEALKLCAEKGYPVLVLSVGIDAQRQEKLSALVAQRGVDALQIPLKEERPDLYFEIDGHWNPAGHEYAASAILDYIRMNPELLSLMTNTQTLRSKKEDD